MAEGYHDAIMRRLSLIGEMGSYTPAARVSIPQQPSRTYSIQPYPNTSRGGRDTFENFVNAIVGQESGGNYRARNPSSGALGKYQIMPGNIPSWSREILGRSVTPQQFYRSPQLQEQIARGKLNQYYRRWGPEGAAVAWYAGPGTASKYLRNPQAYTRRQGAYPSISAYALTIRKRMGLA